MLGSWEWWTAPESDEKIKGILQDLTAKLLADQANQEGGQTPQEAARKDLRSAVEGNDPVPHNALLVSARESRSWLDSARSAAVREFGRLELATCGFGGALVAYLGLHFGISGNGTGATWLIVTVLVLAVVACVARRITRHHWHKGHVDEALKLWRDDVRDSILESYLIQRINFREARAGERLETTLAACPSSVADGGRELDLAVSSDALTEVGVTARAIGSGSIGVSGPRGAGKTTILSKFDTRGGDTMKPAQDIRVNVAAPVDYNAQEFIIHLFRELCKQVQREAVAWETIQADASRHLSRLTFLNTYSSSWGATLVPTVVLNLTGTRGRESAEQPAGLPAVVTDFRGFAEQVADWNRRRVDRKDGRLIIGIDEMDKIRDSDRAVQFLNDIKAIFDVPGCLYLVAISEDAMNVFASRTPAIRTAFDSAFDEIVSVRPMRFEQAQELLDQRFSGIPRPFLALCQVLAGGVPRELIRAARSLIHEVDKLGPETPTLANVTRRLIKTKCAIMRQEAILQLARIGADKDVLLQLHRPYWPGTSHATSLKPADLELAEDKLNRAAAGTGNGHAPAQGDDAQAREDPAGMYQDVAVALSLYKTVIELFCERENEVTAALEGKAPYLLIDDLAVARHAMRINSEFARSLLGRYQSDHPRGGHRGGS
jgi:hypothetical protein